ncbi:MAG: Brp/Blh family beta-carotene 15,15'-dioxygenase [Verrucomicrobiota bacterium]
MSAWWVDVAALASALVFLLSLVLLGMPHGALDHYVYFRSRGKRMSAGPLLGFMIVYLLVAGVMVALWWVAPLVCAFLLLGLTWYHWGEGEILSERARGHSPGLAFGVWRGALPMLAPYLLYPGTYAGVLLGAVRVVDPGVPADALNWLQSPGLRAGTAVLLLTLGAIAWSGYRPAGRETRRRWAGEDLALLTLLVALPPLAGIGLYFIFWHARRHIHVLATYLGPPLQSPGGGIAWGSFYWRAAPFTLGGVAVVAGIALFGWSGEDGVTRLVGAYLIALWGLTWPHAVVCHEIYRVFRKS